MRLTVKDEDVAIVISPKMGLRIAIPKDDPVPYHVLFAVAITSLISKQDKEFLAVIRKQIRDMKKASKKEGKRKERV